MNTADDAQQPSRVGPVLLFIPILATALVVLHFIRNPSRSAERTGEMVDEPVFDALVQGWKAGDESGARLVPYRLSASWNQAWGAVLASRFDWEPGELWRLEMPAGSADLGDVRVRFADVELLPFAVADSQPMSLLLDAAKARRAERPTYLLWGPRPSGAGVIMAIAEAQGFKLDVVPAEFDVLKLERSAWDVSRLAGASGTSEPAEPDQVATLEARVLELQTAFQDERTRRQDREMEWYEFNRTIAALNLSDLPRFQVDEERLPDGLPSLEPDEPEEFEDADARRRRTRSSELKTALRALFLSQRLSNLDLLEAGILNEGALGPVVFRMLDQRGRLSGTLTAKRLRLEASRAGRTLTLVLEDGGESRAGVDYPFFGGVRRILFHETDPAPWIDSMSELFAGEAFERADDGNWPLVEVRTELNRLLAMDTSVGWYRLRAFSGVVGEELREVHLEELDADGHIRRRLFADRLGIFVKDGGVLLVAHDGMMMRGEDRQAFLDGVHRIYLPDAPLDAWRETVLPGTGFAKRTVNGG